MYSKERQVFIDSNRFQDVPFVDISDTVHHEFEKDEYSAYDYSIHPNVKLPFPKMCIGFHGNFYLLEEFEYSEELYGVEFLQIQAHGISTPSPAWYNAVSFNDTVELTEVWTEKYDYSIYAFDQLEKSKIVKITGFQNLQILQEAYYVSNPNGKILEHHLYDLSDSGGGGRDNYISLFLYVISEKNEHYYFRFMNFYHYILNALSLIHCRNIKLVENDPNLELPSRIRKHWENKGKSPLKKYYTLEIKPMKEVLRKDGGIERNDTKKALHICRGHYSHYEEGKGLFGKYHGTYWIPMHVKGNRENGEIEKDYKIVN